MIKTHGIVFRAFKYRETSLIVDIYTNKLGIRSYLINGVRSAKSKTSGNVLQPMNQLDLTVYDKHGADKLNRIKDFKLAKYYQKIPFNVVRSMIGQFMIEISKKCLKDDESNPQLYTFIESWFNFLDESPEKINNIIPLFLVELASEMGFAFQIERLNHHEFFDMQEGIFTDSKPEHHHYIDGDLCDLLFQLINVNRQDVHHILMTNMQRSNLIDHLIIYMKLHIDSFGELKSLDILRSILS